MHASVEYNKLGYQYETPQQPIFRDTSENVLAYGQKDFKLRNKLPPMENRHGLTDFDRAPRFHEEKRRKRLALRTEAEGLEGKETWVRNHPINHRYVQLANRTKRMPMSTQHLNGASLNTFSDLNMKKDEWCTAYLELARTV